MLSTDEKLGKQNATVKGGTMTETEGETLTFDKIEAQRNGLLERLEKQLDLQMGK